MAGKSLKLVPYFLSVGGLNTKRLSFFYRLTDNILSKIYETWVELQSTCLEFCSSAELRGLVYISFLSVNDVDSIEDMK
jgi:hypothetical protein